jgi:hypothetical protein
LQPAASSSAWLISFLLDEVTLLAIRYLCLYALRVCAALFWASFAARFAKWFVPAAAIPTFVVVAVLGISFETFRLLVQLRRGKLCGFAFFCFILSRFSVLYALILGIGGIIEHYVGGDWGYVFDWYGFVIGGMYVLAITSYLTHQRALDEDEKRREVKPGEKEELRRYMHPYI